MSDSAECARDDNKPIHTAHLPLHLNTLEVNDSNRYELVLTNKILYEYRVFIIPKYVISYLDCVRTYINTILLFFDFDMYVLVYYSLL